MKTTLLLNALLLAVLLAPCQADCPTDPDTCLDCQTLLSCGTGDTTPTLERKCGTGKVCKPTGDGASCVADSEVPECACSAPVICDQYNPKRLRVCVDGAQVDEHLCTKNAANKEEVCIPESGTCDLPPITTTTTAPTTTLSLRPPSEGCTDADKFKNKPTSPDCMEYALCNGKTALVNLTCEAGSFLDELTGTCADAPPKPCSGGCVGDYCSDPLDCTHYHKCEAGKVISTFSCKDGEYYDYDSGACGDAVANCDPRTACVHGATVTTLSTATPTTTSPATNPSTEGPGSEGTTTTPSGSGAVTTPPPSACSSSTAYQIWPDPEDCKGYYRCLPTESGSFAMARGKCSGRLEFNSKKSQCDLKGKGDC